MLRLFVAQIMWEYLSAFSECLILCMHGLCFLSIPFDKYLKVILNFFIQFYSFAATFGWSEPINQWHFLGMSLRTNFHYSLSWNIRSKWCLMWFRIHVGIRGVSISFSFSYATCMKQWMIDSQWIVSTVNLIALQCFAFPPNRNRILKSNRWRFCPQLLSLCSSEGQGC